MKLAIISDTHDNLTNLNHCLAILNSRQIDGLIHCGDVATLETLAYLLDNFSGPIKLACGNAEINREQFFTLADQNTRLEVFADLGEWSMGQDQKLAFIHRPDQTEKLAQLGDYTHVFYGHTHQPWIKQVGGTLIANPGALTGGSIVPTFALLDLSTGHLELTRL